jgi:lycopene cyclase domain-containing protein
MRLTYLLVLAGCLLATLPLEIVLNARVYRRWQRAFLAILPVSTVFLAWDLLATYAGWWWFDDDYVTGLFIGPLPIEEILFFLVVPVCGLLTYEGVRFFRPQWARPAPANSGDPVRAATPPRGS